MSREKSFNLCVRKYRPPSNIDEYFDSVMASVELNYPYHPPVSRANKLPDVPKKDAEYHSSQPSEPVIVVYDPGDGHEVVVSESFVKACYDGKFGGIEYSLDMLAGMICRAMEPYIMIV